jgi:hypothetical protein
LAALIKVTAENTIAVDPPNSIASEINLSMRANLLIICSLSWEMTRLRQKA